MFRPESLIGSLVILLTALGLLASRAQPIQPEVLFEFPHGNLPHQPENPYGNLIQGTDGNFYGTTERGGAYHRGTVFKVTANGFISIVASFDGTNGAAPHAGLTLGPDWAYYGTAWLGGSNSAGTVYKVTTNGVLTLLVTFNNTNGYYPEAGLTLGPDENFYGTTSGGGTDGGGTVFKVTTNGALTTLVSFSGANGAGPYGALTLGPDGNFYGTTSSDGGNGYGYGTVFRVATNGDFTTLVSFDGTNGDSCRAALTLGPDGNFYGTTLSGSGGYGTVFRVTTNGVLTRIVAFNGVNGFGPLAPLTLAPDGSLFGTTGWGGGSGGSGYGTIFRVTTNGSLTRLLAFNGSNGAEPHSGLTLASDGNFYGTSAAGGAGGNGAGVGTVFRITPAGGGFKSLASFGSSDGMSPSAGLTLGNDGNFYGTTSSGGSNGYGMVFKFATNGTLNHLASFNNANGAYPHTALTLGNDGNFYGTTADGGDSPVGYVGVGTIFRVTTNGTLTRLYSFFSPNNANGAYPQAPLTKGNDGSFYGTASGGGLSGYGTVFRMTPGGTVTRLASFNSTNGNPIGALALGNDGNLYGTTSSGSAAGGTVFRIAPNGAFTNLASFSLTNRPQGGGLTLGPDGNFYGLTYFVGSQVSTLFRISTEGTVTTLLTFSNTNGPAGALMLGPDGNFYGTGAGGSSVQPGKVFQVTTNGSVATVAFFSNTNGASPVAPVTFGLDGNLYGATSGGGDPAEEWAGTIFRISRREPVVISQPQPVNQIVKAGVDVTITASIFGAVPLSVQWAFNNEDLSGQTNTSLTLHNVTPSMSGTYALRVSNSLSNIWSSNAVVTVLPALITNRPVTGITATGAALSGSITPSATATLVWFEWGTNTGYGNIAGVTLLPAGAGTTLFSSILTGLAEGVGYHYRVVAWNSFGIVYGPDQAFQVGLIYAYAQSVLADEPLVYYRFNETNGTLAVNSGFLGEAANGTYNPTVSLGNPGLIPRFGYSARFNNTNSGVLVPALGSYNQITIEFWANPRSFGTGPPTQYGYFFDSIYTVDDWAAGALHTHLINNSNFFPPRHQYEFSINGNTPQWIDVGHSGLFPSNGWVYVAATYDSAARRVITYVNGQPLATNIFTTAVPVNLTPAQIGGNSGLGSYFDGNIDEFAIYGSDLPVSRIQAHYQAAIGNPVLFSALVTNRLALFWNGPGFRLERNADLSNASGWSPVIGGSNSPVSLTLSNSAAGFFRLIWP